MKVLVTGGAGFIGSWLIRTLLEKGHEVVNLDLLTYAGNLENLADVENHAGYRFIHGDICDAALVNDVIRKVDACVHAAAETHVDRSITNPSVFIETNVVGTHVLLDAALNHPLSKFVLVSTDEVYGSLPLDTLDTFTEESPLKPNSPYAASKAGADLMATAYHKTFGLPVCITRCGNNYGPYQYPEKLIPFFILNAIQDKPLPMYGDGKNVRDWIHVQDHAEAIVAVLEIGKPGHIYNIGADNEQHNLDITRMLLKHLEKPESLIRFVEDRPGHDRRYALDASKIKKELGWSPRFVFENALGETITWYLKNPDWIHHVEARAERENVGPGAAWLKK